MPEELSLRKALRFVATTLPDKSRDEKGVLDRALKLLEGAELVTTLVRRSPRHFSIDRSAVYRSILRNHFGDEEAVEIYLGQFPLVLTSRQKDAVERALIRQWGLSAERAAKVLEHRFIIRQSPRRTSDHSSCASFV